MEAFVDFSYQQCPVELAEGVDSDLEAEISCGLVLEEHRDIVEEGRLVSLVKQDESAFRWLDL